MIIAYVVGMGVLLGMAVLAREAWGWRPDEIEHNGPLEDDRDSEAHDQSR